MRPSSQWISGACHVGRRTNPQAQTPKLPLNHGWAHLLSGKAFPAMTSKLALVGNKPAVEFSRASPKRDALHDLLFRATLPHNLPATSPESIGGFLQRFHHSRRRHRSPDDLIHAPPTLDSALAEIDDRSARRVGPFSHRWPTIRSQPTRKPQDDLPEQHRLPTARTFRLCRLHRQRLGLRPSAHHLLDTRKDAHAALGTPDQSPDPADILHRRALAQTFDLDEPDEGGSVIRNESRSPPTSPHFPHSFPIQTHLSFKLLPPLPDHLSPHAAASFTSHSPPNYAESDSPELRPGNRNRGNHWAIEHNAT